MCASEREIERKKGGVQNQGKEDYRESKRGMRVEVEFEVEMEVMKLDGINRDCCWSTDVGV